MFQGNWKCSKCGGVITELPFEPRGESGLTCRTCYTKGKAEGETPMESAAVTADMPDMSDIPQDAGFAGEQPLPPEFADAPVVPAEKLKFQGDWKCSMCGGAITSLPFQPRSTENLKCLDCFKKSKA